MISPPPIPRSSRSCRTSSCRRQSSTVSFPSTTAVFGSALQRRFGRPSRSDGRPYLTHAQLRHDRHERKRLYHRQEPFLLHHRRPRNPARRRRHGVILAQGRPASAAGACTSTDGKPAFCYNFLGLIPVPGSLLPAPSPSANPPFAWTSPTTVAASLEQAPSPHPRQRQQGQPADGRVRSTRNPLVFSARRPRRRRHRRGHKRSSDDLQGEGDENAFTGKILKVVVDVQPVGTARKSGRGQEPPYEAALKKALAD